MRGEVPTIRPDVPAPRGDAEWFAQSVEYYADNDAAQSGTIGSGQETWMQTTVVGPGNVSFYYKMSSVSGDSLAFYIDTNLAASWSSGSSWNWTGNFAVPSGTHTLKWKYYKDSGSTAGSCWIDAIQWSGSVPGSGGGADWEQITYTYDPSGRRIAKDVDGVVTKYLYDGDQCIAEYDGSNNLLRKYIYGPCIDEPICMIEAAGGYAGTYYYHFDALGSVVALSDADGDTVQVYEYDVYGQVAASDPNHPNRFLFTGREFDAETGLYYYRARYYNPTIGRFLQTDPAGQSANPYAYCDNAALNLCDPSGLVKVWKYPPQQRPKGDGFGWWLTWTTSSRGGYRELPNIWPYTHEAPVEGEPWTLKQFFWYYQQNGTAEAWGEGWAPAAVDLGDPSVNLLEKFKAAPQIVEFVEWYKAQVIGKAGAIYGGQLYPIWQGQPGGSATVAYSSHEKLYNFTTVEYANDLIALGHGYLYCDANGVVTSDGWYKITITFSINDWFADILDPHNKLPDSTYGWLDFDDCMPYPITGRWTITISGRVT